jgi:hypothetical protein
VDALHLQPVADVDPGGAGVATQAPQSTQSPSIARCARFLAALAARLAAVRVVGDDQRLLVEQGRLPAPVRTGDEAGLLAEPGEVEEDSDRRDRHHEERPVRWSNGERGTQRSERVGADEVGEEGVAQHRGRGSRSRPRT